MTVYRAIKQYQQLGNTEDRRGRSVTVTNLINRKIIRKKINRNSDSKPSMKAKLKIRF